VVYIGFNPSPSTKAVIRQGTLCVTMPTETDFPLKFISFLFNYDDSHGVVRYDCFWD